MKWLFSYRFLITTGLFIVSFILLYPLYQFILDDDGIGYAMVTRRWAEGDYFNAINGYWSPLHSWLALPFYKAGCSLVDAFKVSNAFISVGILYMVHHFLKAIDIGDAQQFIVLTICIPIVLYMSFYQLAADILFCFLFLLYVACCYSGDLFARKEKIIWCVLVGWLAYLSKAYAFPLFIVHFITWQWWLSGRSLLPGRKLQLAKNILLGLSVFLLLSLPWIIALHHKYGIWTFGYSGRLNLSWELSQGTKLESSFLTGPHLPDSPGLWEDPWFAQGQTLNSFSSVTIFHKQLRLILHNCLAALRSFHELSFLSIGLLMAMLLYAYKTGSSFLMLIFVSALLLPAGYLVVHIEPRFLWPLIFLLMLAGIYLLLFIFRIYHFPLLLRLFCWMVFAASFLVTPLNELQDMQGGGKNVYALAEEMRTKGISGKISSTLDHYSELRRACFLAGNQYYEPTSEQYSFAQLKAALEKTGIDYYYLFYNNQRELESFQRVFNHYGKQIFFPAHQLLVLQLKQ